MKVCLPENNVVLEVIGDAVVEISKTDVPCGDSSDAKVSAKGEPKPPLGITVRKP